MCGGASVGVGVVKPERVSTSLMLRNNKIRLLEVVCIWVLSLISPGTHYREVNFQCFGPILSSIQRYFCCFEERNRNFCIRSGLSNINTRFEFRETTLLKKFSNLLIECF